MDFFIKIFVAVGLILSVQSNSVAKIKTSYNELNKNPWTSLELKDQSENFNFAIVGDRAGGHCEGIFQDAILKLNKLNPDFVLSVGDLIDTKDIKSDSARINNETIGESWRGFEKIIQKLEVPFFYTAGNNDIRNRKMENYWFKKFGQTYYSFTNKNNLFIILNTEDYTEGRRQISKKQLKWLETILHENNSVNHTFIFFHRPVWQYENNKEWVNIEKLIKERSTTLFAGHHHKYSKTTINNNIVCYRLATTGGKSNLSGIEKGQFDHIVWISVSKDEAEITNIILDGIWGDDPIEEFSRKKFRKKKTN